MLALMWFTTKGSKDLLRPTTIPISDKQESTLYFRVSYASTYVVHNERFQALVNSYNDFDNSFGVGKYR